MTLSGARLFPLALAAALALLTLWLEQVVRREGVAHPSLRRHDPDFVVERLALSRYGPDGRLEAVLSAARMVHYPDDDSTELIAPRMVQTKPDEPRLIASASRATLSHDGEEIFFHGDVRLVREDARGGGQTEMRTEFLHVVHAKSLVRTDRDIVIVDERRRLTARGMSYYNDSGTLVLYERVRGEFAPPRAARTAP
ncbi:MAG: LPS export ABC transporter periplasmic protein LptC [Burkholderiales bacterium]|nr:LPS export ABC transporter periplasmic protein LptC [Burkholderiales bacterium]